MGQSPEKKKQIADRKTRDTTWKRLKRSVSGKRKFKSPEELKKWQEENERLGIKPEK